MNVPPEFGISITPNWQEQRQVGPVKGEPLVGPASYWVDEIGRLAEMGMDAFIFWPGGENPIAQAELFAIEVASVVRGGAVAQART